MSSPAGRKWLEHWAQNDELADPEVIAVALQAIEDADTDYLGSYIRALLARNDQAATK